MYELSPAVGTIPRHREINLSYNGDVIRTVCVLLQAMMVEVVSLLGTVGGGD